MRKALRSCVALLLVVCYFKQSQHWVFRADPRRDCDLLWSDQIKPLLLQKYPGASEDDLRKAHAYAYGGCLIQDMGYYPLATGSSAIWSTMFAAAILLSRCWKSRAILMSMLCSGSAVALRVRHYRASVCKSGRSAGVPKLRMKYGAVVTYGQDPKAHIRTEFGFDVVQVAKRRYTSDVYHDFIGFEVSKPLLERAFLKTYGIKLADIFASLDLSIGTFRRSISGVIPEMTRVALLAKQDEMVKEDPSFARKKFLYNLKRSEYEKEWGKNYQKPGCGAHVLALLFKLVPRPVHSKQSGFKMPSPETETLYLKSIKQHRGTISNLSSGRESGKANVGKQGLRYRQANQGGRVPSDGRGLCQAVGQTGGR